MVVVCCCVVADVAAIARVLLLVLFYGGAVYDLGLDSTGSRSSSVFSVFAAFVVDDYFVIR